MAISGSFYGKTSNSGIKPKITWEAVANEQGNYSDVTATLSYTRTDSYSTYGHWAGSITINGDTKNRSGHYMVINKNGDTLAVSHTVRVNHNDNGTKTITISGAGGITETTLTYTNISADVALETIPRAATIAASDGDIGSTVVVTIGKKSDKHRYVVAYSFGSLSGYLTESGLSSKSAYTQAASLAFPLPESFYGQIPDKATGVCTLTCTTYMGDTKISTPKQATFTVRANPDRCGPQVTGTVVDVNPKTIALTGNENSLVRGVSTAMCVINAQARCQATLTQKKIAEKAVTGNSLQITGVTEDKIRFWAKDSRGHTGQIMVQKPMVAYFTPVIRLEAARKDAISGDGLLTAQGSFYNGSFGVQKNSLQLRWRLNEGGWQTLVPTLDGNGFSASADLSGMDYTRSHKVTLEVTDALQKITVVADIQPGIPIFDWGKEDFAFHVPVLVQGVDILAELLKLKEAIAKSSGS